MILPIFASLIILLAIPGAESDVDSEYRTLLLNHCQMKKRDAQSKPWHRSDPFKIQARFANSSVQGEILFKLFNADDEEMEFDPNNVKNGLFVIKPHFLSSGLYHVKTYTNLPGDTEPVQSVEKCWIYIQEETPLAVISGGVEIMVKSWSEFNVSGEESVDMSVSHTQPSTLTYKWTCNQAKNNRKYCKPKVMTTEVVFRIPANFVETGEMFNITLTVTSYDRASASASIMVVVVDDAAKIKINCAKNCPPVAARSNPFVNTLFYSECEENCEGVKDDSYQWSIWHENQDITSQDITTSGVTGKKFGLKKNKLKPGIYKIVITLTGSLKGRAVTLLTIEEPPVVSSCVILPKAGRAMFSYFRLNCTSQKGSNYFYEVLVGNEAGDLIYSDFGSALPSARFFLPAVKNYLVRISTDSFGTSITIPVTVDVRERISKASTPEEVIGLINIAYNGTGKPSFKPVEELIASGDEARAIQRLQVLIDDVIKVKLNDNATNTFMDNLKQLVIQDLLKAPLGSLKELLQGSQVMGKLMTYKESPESDPELSKLATTICKKMAAKQLELVKEERFSLQAANATSSISAALAQCVEANTNPNFEILKPMEPFNYTTKKPVIISDLKEDYPDYKDYDDKYYNHIENLEETTYNIVKTSQTSAKVIAMTTAVGEVFVEKESNVSKIIVAKDIGSVLANTTLHCLEVTLKPSQDFANSDHPFDILLSTWRKDLMWWNQGRVKVITNIISVEFWHSTCKERVTKFKKPVHVYFKVRSGVVRNKTIIDDNVTVPEGFASMNDQSLDYFIKVRRVELKRHQGVVVKFFNVTETLDVVLTSMKFPTAKDFVLSKTITGLGNDSLYYRNNEDFDIWCYLGVLPSRTLISNSSATRRRTISYGISFATSNCMQWKVTNRSWEPACKPGASTEDDVIHCECHSFSVMAGEFKNVPSKSQEVEFTQHLLKLQVNYVVFLLLTATFAIYCILLVLTIKPRKNEIYFLADNCRKHLYAYLVIVQTGSHRKSGTTSNVTIKLLGKNEDSDAHVLNYPDPEMRMLQSNGEDWFVLTTLNHLGALRQIELWSDSVGSDPSWYCRDVMVCDLQNQTKWLFRVRKRLTVSKGLTHVAVEAVKPKGVERRIGKKLKICDSFHSWYFGKSEGNFSSVKRATVILSTITTTNAVTLVFYGLPTLQLRDGLDFFGQYEFGGNLFSITLGASLLSFCVHISLSWIFRFSEIQFFAYEEHYKFPLSVTITCWIVVTTLIVISSTILLVFGFWTPHFTALIWLTSCLIAMILDVMIFENIVVFCRNFLVKTEWNIQLTSRLDKVLLFIEDQRKFLYKKFGECLLRPYFQHLYVPISVERIKEKTVLEKNRNVILNQLEDLAMFGIYIVILYMVILANKDFYAVLNHNEIVDLIQGKHTRSLSFLKALNIYDMYAYLNLTLIKATQSPDWYGNMTETDPGMMKDFTNKYLGVVRLRQHRIINDTCSLPKSMNFLHTTCDPEYSPGNSQQNSFGPSWRTARPHQDYDRLRNIWRYSPSTETGTISFMGKCAIYPGGGYVAPLGRTYYNSLMNLGVLERKRWLEENTRTVFIEFLSYNANYNMFNAVTVLFELSATGYIHQMITIQTARMLFVQNEMAKVTSVAFILFAIWVGLLTLKKSVGIAKNFRTFFRDFWLMVDVFIIVMSLACMIMFVVRMKLVGDYLDILERVKHNEFINYFNLFYMEDTITIFAAFLLCVATIRLWKLLRFVMFLRLMERTLVIAAVPLLSFALYNAVLVLAFSLAGLLLFGNNSNLFDSVIDTVTTLMLITLNLYRDFDRNTFTRDFIAYAYFATFSILMRIIQLLYITIIILSYFEAQLEFSKETNNFTIKEYIREQFGDLPKVLKFKWKQLRAGQNEKLLVTPKADEFRYANCLSTRKSQFSLMVFLVKCVIRNKKQTARQQQFLCDYDMVLMSKICKLIVFEKVEGADKEVFFKGTSEKRTLKLVDEKKISKIARVANLLLIGAGMEPSLKEEPNKVHHCRTLVRKNLRTLRHCQINLIILSQRLNRVKLTNLNKLY